MTILMVTGTGTAVGKTVVTAALAAVALSAGQRVRVVKVAQTGIEAGEESDVEVVTRLAGVIDTHELARYPEPLAPATAARRAGIAALPVARMVATIAGLPDVDLTLVEGAGGILVRLDDTDATLADVALGLGAPVLVVTNAGLGALNSAALTCEAIRSRGLECAGLVIGSWPSDPDVAAMSNLDDFSSYAGVPLVGVLPEDSGRLQPAAFREVAVRGLAPQLGGVWRAADHLAAGVPDVV